MSGTKRVLTLLVVLVAMIAGCAGMAAAQVPTTTVSDTVYSANGTAGGWHGPGELELIYDGGWADGSGWAVRP